LSLVFDNLDADYSDEEVSFNEQPVVPSVNHIEREDLTCK